MLPRCIPLKLEIMIKHIRQDEGNISTISNLAGSYLNQMSQKPMINEMEKKCTRHK